MITVLTTPEELALDEVTVRGDVYRHLFRSRRLAAGARLRAVDGEGRARWGEVVRIGKGDATIELAGPAPANEPSYRLDLVVAALRPERASWLVEKVTELGVAGVHFVRSQRTPRQYGGAGLERLRRVAAAAVVQCHRARVPEVSGVDPWQCLPALVAGAEDRYFLHPRAAGAEGAWQDPRGTSGTVVIGPEGGFSADERDRMAELGCAAVDLGPRVLRTETAAVVAAARLLLHPAEYSGLC